MRGRPTLSDGKSEEQRPRDSKNPKSHTTKDVEIKEESWFFSHQCRTATVRIEGLGRGGDLRNAKLHFMFSLCVRTTFDPTFSSP